MDSIMAAEGGWASPSAVEGGMRLAVQCRAMGPPWTMIHPQTGRMLFLRLRFMFWETHTHCWSMFKNEISNYDIAASEPSRLSTPGSVDQLPTGKPQRTAAGAAAGEHRAGNEEASQIGQPQGQPQGHALSPKGKGKAAGGAPPAGQQQAGKAGKGPGGGPPAGGPPDGEATGKRTTAKVKTSLEKKFDEANKVKARFRHATGTALNLMHQVKTVKEWEWADNDKNAGRLQTLLQQLRGKMSPTQMLYSTEEPGVLKKKYGEDALMEELSGFIALGPSINELGEAVQTMQRRHVVPTSSTPKASRKKA